MTGVYMYLFITYARVGMKGVQARAIRVANELKKNADVLFWNDGDSSWLKKENLPYKELNFKQFAPSRSIQFPKGVKAVIFADLPTNRPLQSAVLVAARNKKIPTVILENQYRKNQEKEGVYRAVMAYSDLLIFNGLSYLHSSPKEQLKYTPPLLPAKLKKEEAKRMLKKRIKSGIAKHLIVCVGYNEKVINIVDKLTDKLKKEKNITVIVISTANKRTRDNLIFLEQQNEEEMAELFSACDLVLAKPGFLQVQEALAYGLPLITLGEDAGFRREWIDEKTINAVKHYNEFSQKLLKEISAMKKNNLAWQQWQAQVSELHSGVMDGSKKIADQVAKVSFKEKNYPKKILICLDKQEEREVAKGIVLDSDFILPIYLSAPFFTGEKNNALEDFRAYEKGAILQQQSEIIIDFGWDSVHGFSKLFPVYDGLMDWLQNIISQAEEVIIVGKETESYIKEILQNASPKAKINIVDKSNFMVNKRGK